MIIPLFPLPNVVLFPKTPLPLYIFEERYRTMIKDVLNGDKELVIALLRSDHETKYSRGSAVHEIACLGRIESHEELEDCKYNIVVVGIHRVRIIGEIQHSPYRLVEIEELEEPEPDEQSETVIQRQNQLGGLFARFTELATGSKQDALQIMPQLDFESLVNIVAMTLNLTIEQKQYLLEIEDISDRCDALIPVLQEQLEVLTLVRKFENIKPENPGLN